MKLGDPAPAFELPATDGSVHSLAGGGPSPTGPTVIAFTCNHCPYALKWHDRLIAVARDYEGTARMLMINPNDAERMPRDSFGAMKERVAADGGWPAPYLRDESQAVSHTYGAQTTPDLFVLDAEGRLRYRGAPDADYDDPSQDAAWLRAALDALLAGSEPDPAETKPVGCSIKWSQ